MKRHAEKVICLDVALIDCTPRGHKINLGYIIIHHMLSISAITNRSFPYDSSITLKHFRQTNVLLSPLNLWGEKANFSLGFDWKDGQWVKVSKKRYTLIAQMIASDGEDILKMSYLPISCLISLNH